MSKMAVIYTDLFLDQKTGILKFNSVLTKLNGAIKPETRVKELTEQQVGLLNGILTKEYRVEGELRREVAGNLGRLAEIGSYRGFRHRRALPVRGQRTRTNARTRRGRRKTVGVGKATSPTGKN